MSPLPTVHYSAAGGVVIKEHPSRAPLVLLLDRPERNEVRLPKGHIDRGEAPEQTALRETTEETGYRDLEILADLGERTSEFDYQGKHYVRGEHYYLMRLVSERRRPRPPKDATQFRVRWSTLASASSQLTYPAEQAVVEAAITAYRRLRGT